MANSEWQKHLADGTYIERRVRAREKEAQILDFLSIETYSDSKNLALLIGLGVQSAKITLTKMEAKGWLSSAVISLGGRGVGIKYWGITPRGLFEQAEEQSVDRVIYAKHFQPSMVNVVTTPHKFDMQTVILQRDVAIATGLTLKGVLRSNFPTRDSVKFENPWVQYNAKGVDLTSFNRKSLIVPDAIFKANLGEDLVFAVELELTIKTAKRYKAIFSGHYRNILKAKLYNVVLYVLATKKERLVFSALIDRIFAKELDDKFKEMLSRRVFYTSLEEIKHVDFMREIAQDGA
jgi:hypothetical protein